MIEKNDILYFFIVVIIAAALAMSYTGMTHEPVPLQVQENRFPVVTFTPAVTPAPNMPTYAPQLVPGSYADTHPNNTANGNFSPAQAPVVVTTIPLPTITTIPTSAAVPQTTKCCNAWNATTTEITNAYGGIRLASPLVTILLITLILAYLIRLSPTRVVNDCLNQIESNLSNRFENADSSVIGGVIMMFVGLMVVVAIMAIAPAIGGSIMAAQPSIGCVPC